MFLGLHRKMGGDFGTGNKRRGLGMIEVGLPVTFGTFKSARGGTGGCVGVGVAARVLLDNGADGLGRKLETVTRSGSTR